MNVDNSNLNSTNTEFKPGNLYQGKGDLFLCSRMQVGGILALINVRNGSSLVTLNHQFYEDVTNLYTLKANKR